MCGNWLLESVPPLSPRACGMCIYSENIYTVPSMLRFFFFFLLALKTEAVDMKGQIADDVVHSASLSGNNSKKHLSPDLLLLEWSGYEDVAGFPSALRVSISFSWCIRSTFWVRLQSAKVMEILDWDNERDTTIIKINQSSNWWNINVKKKKKKKKLNPEEVRFCGLKFSLESNFL